MKVRARAGVVSLALILAGLGWAVNPVQAQAAGDLTAPIPTVPAKAGLVAISAGRILANINGEYKLSTDDGESWQDANVPLGDDCSYTPDCVMYFGTVAEGILPLYTSMGNGTWYSLTENREVGTAYEMADGEDVQHSNGGFVQLATWDFPNVGDYRVLSMDGTTYPIDAEPAALMTDGSLITTEQSGTASVVSRTAPGAAAPVELFSVEGAISNVKVSSSRIGYYANGKVGIWSFADAGQPIDFPVTFAPGSGDLHLSGDAILVNTSSHQTVATVNGQDGTPAVMDVATTIPGLPGTQDSGRFVGSSVDDEGSYLHWLKADASVEVESIPVVVRAYPQALALTPHTLIVAHESKQGSSEASTHYWKRSASTSIGDPVDLGIEPSWYGLAAGSADGWAAMTNDGVRVFDGNGGSPRDIGEPHDWIIRASGSRVLTTSSLWSTSTGWFDRGDVKDIYLDRNLVVTNSADGAVAKVKDLAGTELNSVTFAEATADAGVFSLWGDWVAASWVSPDTFEEITKVTNLVTGESYTSEGWLDVLGDGFAVLRDTSANYTLWSFVSGQNRSLGSDKTALRRFATDGARLAYTTETEYVITTPGVAQSLTTTPQPTIEGTAEVGATLTAVAGTWEPAGVALSYQWLRNGTAITGATAATYQVTEADLGGKLSVAVTGTLSGYEPSTQTSVEVEVAAAALTQTPQPTIDGAALVGQTLSAAAGTWEPAPVDLAYRWLRDGIAIDGATSATYELGAADLGKKISVEVTGSKAGYQSATQVSVQTEAVGVTGDLPLTATPTPSIGGTVRVGETLSAEAGTWEPAPVELSFQWLRDGTPIAGATSATYVLTADDLGASLTVAVTGSKAGYLTSAPQTSAATAAVERGVLQTTPVPTIDNTKPMTDVVLTADPHEWAPGEVSFKYQWYERSSAGVITEISGATEKSYRVPASQLGRRLRVQVTGTMAGGDSVAKDSAWTSSVTRASFTTKPVPTIKGDSEAGDIFRVGMPLKLEAGSWEPKPDLLRYQWYKVSTDGVTSIIAGATKDTYTPAAATEGYGLKVRVAAYRDGYLTTTVYSEVSPIVTVAMVAASPVLNDTTPQVDQELSADPGTWSEGVELSYQWYVKAPTGEVTKIDQATGATYQVPAEYLGHRLQVSVTGKLAGYATTTKTSGYTSVVAKAAFATAPVPVLTGDFKVGATLTADPAGVEQTAWSPEPDSLTYYWYRSGVLVASGEDLSSYALTSADLGKVIKVKVVATKAGYSTTPKLSLASPRITN